MATSRSPTERELASLKKLLREQRDYFRNHEDEAIELSQRARGKSEPDEFASWLTVSRVLLNLYEVVARY